MNFRIADTFSASRAHLAAQEEKAVNTTSFDLQMDASAPGLSLENSKDTVSVFNGPAPVVLTCNTANEEQASVGAWIAARLSDGVRADEICIFVRSDDQMTRTRSATKAAGTKSHDLTEKAGFEAGSISIATMHLAKGLEFRAVAVLACDDEVLPLQEHSESIIDEAELQETYNTERPLLYVTCTRARDFLHISGVEPASEFLDDFGR